jgi:glycerol uptake facilitator-like aquaporin
MIKRFAALALAGAIVGAILASIVSPRMIAWYNTPGSATAAMCQCAQLASEVTSRLLWSQFIGAVCGALLFVVVAVLVIRARRNKPAAPVASQPAAPTGGQP